MYDLEGGNWKQSVVKIDAGNAADYTTHNKGGNDSWTQLQSAPVVSLAAGDLDRDFCDDLAIVVSAPYGKKNIDKSTHCELFSWDASKGALVHVDALGDAGAISLSANGKTMVAANATFGTFAAYDEEGKKTGETVTGLFLRAMTGNAALLITALLTAARGCTARCTATRILTRSLASSSFPIARNTETGSSPPMG